MAYSNKVFCPHCGGQFFLSAPGETWQGLIGQFLSAFAGSITAINTRRFILYGQHLGMWKSNGSAHYRLNQMETAGYINQVDHGWWQLTEKGITFGRSVTTPPAIVEGVNDPASFSSKHAPPIRVEYGVPKPTEWQAGFLRLVLDFPVALRGIKSIIRFCKREGILGKGGTASIKNLVAYGYLTFDPQEHLHLTGPAKKFVLEHNPGIDRMYPEIFSAADLPSMDRTPGVND